MIDATDATWAELEPLLGIAPDFTPGELPAGVRLDYTHRQVEGREVYFVASNGKQPHALHRAPPVGHDGNGGLAGYY
jgi:hypothetical protein